MTSSPLTEQQLADIEARAGAATPGPWGSRRDLNGAYTIEARPRISLHGMESDGDIATLAAGRTDAEGYRNARFIAHAREDVTALTAEVRRLRAELPKPIVVPSKDTPLSDYDFVELVAFASKVESEGFGYAFEEYPPHFEAPELAPIAADFSLLRQLFNEWEEALDEFWTRSDAEAVYDAHIDEARQRRRVARTAVVETGE
ncbi:MAG: hypothetical protein HOZ81_20230 [Streptomyces sp.]|nr:hypothetical protein [Streptomyces sp.]NUS81869.1 hypothetical protein [Streptomyces sp.]